MPVGKCFPYTQLSEKRSLTFGNTGSKQSRTLVGFVSGQEERHHLKGVFGFDKHELVSAEFAYLCIP